MRLPTPDSLGWVRVDSWIASGWRSFASRNDFTGCGGTFPLSGYKSAKIGGVFVLIVVTGFLTGNFGGVIRAVWVYLRLAQTDRMRPCDTDAERSIDHSCRVPT